MEVSGQPHSPAGLSPWRVDRPQSWSGHGDEKENLFPAPAQEQTPVIQPIV